ncbi:hypothetical protein KI387_026309, partial [Taxus chinensis]
MIWKQPPKQWLMLIKVSDTSGDLFVYWCGNLHVEGGQIQTRHEVFDGGGCDVFLHSHHVHHWLRRHSAVHRAYKMFSCAFMLVGFGFIDILLSGPVTFMFDKQETVLIHNNRYDFTKAYFVDMANILCNELGYVVVPECSA